jgi:hypothetical protein
LKKLILYYTGFSWYTQVLDFEEIPARTGLVGCLKQPQNDKFQTFLHDYFVYCAVGA